MNTVDIPLGTPLHLERTTAGTPGLGHQQLDGIYDTYQHVDGKTYGPALVTDWIITNNFEIPVVYDLKFLLVSGCWIIREEHF